MQPTAPGDGTPTRCALVTSVNTSAVHGFSKPPALEIRLLAGRGVEGDAHCGTAVRHRFARRRDPEAVNLRQVHLFGSELLDDLRERGYPVEAGDLGENVTTQGVDLLSLPRGTVLGLGADATVELTGLRTPCRLVDDFRSGLMRELWGLDAEGRRVRRAGVMAVVRTGGVVRAGDPLTVVPPTGVPVPLGPV
jgi:MOSC domain-containing protein YiiM